MITLTPSGDILLDGLGKVGEWVMDVPRLYSYKVQYPDYILYSYVFVKSEIKDRITKDITNGFTPKKWEE